MKVLDVKNGYVQYYDFKYDVIHSMELDTFVYKAKLIPDNSTE